MTRADPGAVRSFPTLVWLGFALFQRGRRSARDCDGRKWFLTKGKGIEDVEDLLSRVDLHEDDGDDSFGRRLMIYRMFNQNG